MWRLTGRELTLDRSVILGVLNVTPDSFSDGGRYANPDIAVDRGLEMIDDGADLVDVGGESSRPGTEPVPADEEWRRIADVVDRLIRSGVPVTVDTTKAEIARRALDAGACAINDISGLRFEPAIADLAAATGAGLIVMHMRGEPRTMQLDVAYDDLLGTVRRELAVSVDIAIGRGCRPDQIVVDPGIGFGKSTEGNLEILSGLDRLLDLGRPVLVGPSRKSFIGQLLDVPSDQRVEGTIASCVVARDRGAGLFRVHGVGPVRRALDVADAVLRAEGPDKE